MSPVDKKIYRLHQKYAHGIHKTRFLDLIWTHSLIVKDISLQIAVYLNKQYSINPNLDLLADGALVHDIGVYSCFDDQSKEIYPYIQHGIFGYQILKDEKLGESVARFAAVHTGIGLDRQQIIKEKLPLEAKDFIPITLEEEIVTYADCFHSKGHPGFNSIDKVRQGIIRYNPENGIILNRFEEKFGIPDLSALEKKYAAWHTQINQSLEQIGFFA